MAITFLFGSGADTDYCKSLKSGASFSSALLTDSYKREISSLLEEKKSMPYSLVRANSINVFLKTIETYPEKAVSVLGEVCVNKCIEYYNSRKGELQKEIHDMCNNWYKLIKNENEDEVREFFLNYAAFFDTLDVKFNSLRKSPLNDNARRVINAYLTVFVLMLRSLYKIDDDFEWTWKKVFELLDRKYECLITPPKDQSYYQELANRKIQCKVVTTNYTSLAENVTKKEDVIYLHGKLTWFEDYKNLTIYDCSKEEERTQALLNKSTIFPFILIPSGVKPLICHKQIEEFHRFIDALKNSDILCVVGYRFNSEDNHINSIIAEWLRNAGKQLIYFNFNDELKFSKIELFSDFTISKLKPNKQIDLSILQNMSIVDIPVNKENSVSTFVEFLKNFTDDGGYKNV